MIRQPATSADAKCIRVMIVDDHRSVLWGLGKLIDGEAPRMMVVAEATCWKDALNGLGHNPDVILLDLDLGDENGLDLITPLRQRSHARVIILTGLRDPRICEEAVMRGASGFVHKAESPEVILKAISHVHAGELWLEPQMVARVFAALSVKRDRTGRSAGYQGGELTARERAIIAVVVKHKGTPAKVIASSLHISSNTLRNHLAIIYRKLGIHSRIDLILHAMHAGLDKPEGGIRPALDEDEGGMLVGLEEDESGMLAGLKRDEGGMLPALKRDEGGLLPGLKEDEGGPPVGLKRDEVGMLAGFEGSLPNTGPSAENSMQFRTGLLRTRQKLQRA